MFVRGDHLNNLTEFVREVVSIHQNVNEVSRPILHFIS